MADDVEEKTKPNPTRPRPRPSVTLSGAGKIPSRLSSLLSILILDDNDNVDDPQIVRNWELSVSCGCACQ